jgi:two-component system, NtrC family, C4-dicarboxylate transport sensor histidine kinase DctB
VTETSHRVRFGIGGRLIAAFLGMGAFTVGACVAGWLSYSALSGELNALAESHLPSLAFATRLAETSGNVIASTPELALAGDRETFEATRDLYMHRLAQLKGVLEDGQTATKMSLSLMHLVGQISRNLSGIDTAAGQRFPASERLRAYAEELRWLQADLTEEVEPLVDDAKYNIQAAFTRLERNQADEESRQRLKDESRKAEVLLSAAANGNLVAGLLGRVASVSTLGDLEQTGSFLSETADQLDIGAKALAASADTITFRQIAARLHDLTNTKTGVPFLKKTELEAVAQVQDLIAENRRLAAQLGALVTGEVQRAEQASRQAAAGAAASISTGRRMLLAVAILSLAAAAAIGWFYILKNIVARLNELTAAAAHIAEGRGGAHALPRMSNDELGDLTRVLALFRRTRDDLIQSAKLAALGQMAAGISHELSQPLAAIRSHAHNASVLIDRDRAADARSNLAKIQMLTTRMADIMMHIKRFARRPEVALSVVDLRKTLDSALSLFPDRFGKPDGPELVVDTGGGPLLVLAEEVRLAQVLVNLLANALDAMAQSGERRVEITAQSSDGRIALSISDTGTGIPSELAASIFDPFVTTKPPGAGLGLGLTLSYNIIKDLGGTLALTRTGPGGTTFVIDLKAEPS